MPLKFTTLILIPLLYWFSAVSTAETYRWVDSQGKTHFSDRAPINQAFKKVSLNHIQTLNFSEVENSTTSLKKTKSKQNKSANSKSKCQKLKANIKKLESSLTTRQKASDFDKKNEQLVKLRWQKIKSC